MDINPYESPKADAYYSAVSNRSTLRGVTITFTVYTPEPHLVEIYLSRWTGLEIYRIDGIQRLRRYSFAFSDTVRFEIAGAPSHTLEIVSRAFPWPSGRASLDGRPISDDLLPSERPIGATLLVVLVILVAIAVAVAARGLSNRGMLPKWLSQMLGGRGPVAVATAARPGQPASNSR